MFTQLHLIMKLHSPHFAIKLLDSSVFIGTTLTAIHRKMHPLRHTFDDTYVDSTWNTVLITSKEKTLYSLHFERSTAYSFVPTDLRFKITHCQSVFENDNFSFLRHENAYCTIIWRQDVKIGKLTNRKALPLFIFHSYHP